MPDDHQIILAILGGLGFGVLISFVGSTWQRLALLLFLLWTMQTGPQFIYRQFQGTDVAEEVIIVTVLRVTFTVAAVIALALTNRWRLRRLS